MGLAMTVVEMNSFIDKVFPQVKGDFEVVRADDAHVSVRLNVGPQHLRPGGTISGPAMFGLADVTAYMVTLSRIGPRALAVTTNCSIDFMRKPVAGVNLVAQGRLLKLGKQLSVSDVLVFSEGSDKPVARASLTYAIPPVGVDLPDQGTS